MNHKPIENLNLKPYKATNHLEQFGIDLCQDCGAHKSIDNSVCYSCGFEPADQKIHEACLNRKNQATLKQDNTYYLGEIEPGSRWTQKYHIMNNGRSICGIGTTRQANVNIIIIPIAGDLVMKRFNEKPCSYCKKELNRNTKKTA